MVESKSKIQEISKIIVTLLKVAKIVLMIVIGFELSGLIWFLIASNSSFLNLENIIQLESGLRIIIPFDFDVFSSEKFVTTFIGTIVQQGFILAILFIASSIFKTIKISHSPFVQGVANKMKTISLLLIIVNLSTPISINFSGIPSTAELESVLSLTGIIGAFVAAGICYCFAIIFDYGFKLQQESDETL